MIQQKKMWFGTSRDGIVFLLASHEGMTVSVVLSNFELYECRPPVSLIQPVGKIVAQMLDTRRVTLPVRVEVDKAGRIARVELGLADEKKTKIVDLHGGGASQMTLQRYQHAYQAYRVAAVRRAASAAQQSEEGDDKGAEEADNGAAEDAAQQEEG